MLLVRWFHIYAQVWPTKKHPRRQLRDTPVRESREKRREGALRAAQRHSGTGEQGGVAGRCPTSSSAQEHRPPPCAPDTLSRPTGDHLVSPPCSGSGAQSHPHSTQPSVHTLPPARLPPPTNPHKVVNAGMTKPFLSGVISLQGLEISCCASLKLLRPREETRMCPEEDCGETSEAPSRARPTHLTRFLMMFREDPLYPDPK